MARACRIRAARTADLAGIAAIEAASFPDPWSMRQLGAHLADLFLVAEEGEALAGYLVAIVTGPEAEILNVAIAPGRRGQGIGGTLLGAALDELGTRGVRAVYLEVRASNAAALRLYAGRGFREAGRRRGYYDHPREDAIVMRCAVAPGVDAA
jgi:ribosomal-protein-alanine N-acetyltransferase